MSLNMPSDTGAKAVELLTVFQWVACWVAWIICQFLAADHIGGIGLLCAGVCVGSVIISKPRGAARASV